MNRKERRALGNKERVKTYNVSEDRVKYIIKDEIEKAEKKVLHFTTNCLLASFVVGLNTVMNFGPKRINKVLDEVGKQFSLVENGTITEQDLVNCAKDIGIVLQGNKI